VNRNFRIKLAIIMGLVFFSLLALGFRSEQFMTAESARQKWGDVKFEAQKFKAGDSNVRASMAASLVNSKEILGTPLSEIIEKLGPFTGYYFSDLIPAYAIGDLSHGRTETWQIILIPDGQSKVIEKVKIHKKCCYK
jgi:hypothetical protein